MPMNVNDKSNMFNLGNENIRQIFCVIGFMTSFVFHLAECYCSVHQGLKLLTKWSDVIHMNAFQSHNCSWMIHVKDADVIHLNFSYLDVGRQQFQTEKDCMDYIQVEDPYNKTAFLCADLHELEIKQLHLKQPVLLRFHSNSKWAAKRFLVTYKGSLKRIQRQACCLKIDSNITWESPFSPSQCKYEIGLENHFTVLYFKDPNGTFPSCGATPFKYDYGYGLEELCDISAKLFDTVTTLIVNETENVENWNSPIEIEIIPDCRYRVHIDVTDSVRLIYTPFYPNTPTNLFKCTWDLSCSLPFIKIKLVNSTKFPQCTNSPLTVSDATSQLNENLCAQTTSVTASQPLYLTYHYTSKEDPVWVGTIELYPSQTSSDPLIKPKAVPTKRTTDNDEEEGVCTQTYESTSTVSNNCGSLSKQNTITMGLWEGTFSSPDFDSFSTYASIIDCTWVIEIPFSSHIMLVFETFALQDPIIDEDNDYTCEDYVMITEYLDSESSSEIFYKCGTVNRRAYAIISYGNKMEVKFKSDASVNALGFKASYKGLCFRISQDVVGGSVIIPTDKLPQTNSIICRWQFALHQEYLFMIKMLEKNVAFPMKPFCGSSPLKITLYLENVNPVTEDLCKNKVFGSYFLDEFLILVYKWVPRNSDINTWQGTVILKYFKGYESFNCSWMCPQSECQFIISLINFSPVLYCLCSELPLGLTCQEDSGQCKAEECDPSTRNICAKFELDPRLGVQEIRCSNFLPIRQSEMIIRGGVSFQLDTAVCIDLGLCRKTVRNNTVFETPNFPELPSEDKLCVWKLFQIDSYVMVTFVNKSLEAMPNCGYYVIMMSLEDESKFELCKTTPIFLYKGLARLYYKYKKKGDFPNWIGQLDIQYTMSPADADCNRFCSESNCKLSFDANASPNKAVTCICAESHLDHSCTINSTVCKAEECAFESCWQQIQKSSVFLTPNYPMAPSNYIKCVWTIYRPEEIVMIRFMNDSSDGAFLPTCASSPIKLSFGTSSQILCKRQPVLASAGKVILVYDSRSSLIPWVGGVAVDFTHNPNDVNCAWLCSQSSCQLKYVESPHWFTCICKEKYLNLDCSDHNELCMSEPCLLREPETIKNYNHTYCEEEMLNVKPLKWTMTLALLTDVEPCPLPGVMNHTLTRQCLYNESTPQRGQWAHPNITDCIHSAVQNLKESLSNQTSFDEKTTTHVMSVLNTFIDLVNSSSVESSVDHDVIVHIGEILNRASNFKPNSTLTEQSSLSLATKFAKAIDYITDIKSLDKLKNANTKEIGVIMDVVLDSARTFFKTLSESMVVPGASSSNQPTLKVKLKNVDFRLTLWDNKRTLVDGSMSILVGLPPLKSFYPRDFGKALWLYIARLNNVPKLIGISENKTKEIESPSDIMSDVLSVEFFNKSTFSMNEPVILHFTLKNVTRLSYGRLICMSFESNKEDGVRTSFWSEFGCYKKFQNLSHVQCFCTHFSNFGVLMDIYETQRSLSEAHEKTLSIISYVGCSVSIFCCASLIAIYQVLRLRGDRVLIHQQFALCMAIVQIIFIAMVQLTNSSLFDTKMCLVTAITLHYFLTSMFNWMLVEGIHLYVQLIYVFSTTSHIVKYSLFAWVTPVLIVSVAAVVFQEDYRSDKLCWISIKVLRYFLVPTLSVTVIINVIILSHVILIIKKSQSSLNLLSQSEKKLFWTGLKASVSLLPLLGLTWTFAFFIVSAEISTVMVHLFTYLFTIANSFQGLLVFIFHCLLSTEVHIAVRNYYRINFGSQYWERSKSRSEYRSSEYRKSEFDSKEDRVESVILPEPVVSEEVVPQPAASLQRSRQMSEVTGTAV